VDGSSLSSGLDSTATSQKQTLVEGEVLSSDRSRSRLTRMRRGVLNGVQGMQDEVQASGHRYRVAFVGVTYAPGAEWSGGHVSKLVDHYMKWGKSRGIRVQGAWVMEMQERGAPHYHLMLFIPRGFTPPLPDKQGWWVHGSTKAMWVRSPVGYLVKYQSKLKSKQGAIMPKGARLFGLFGCSNQVRGNVRWWLAPKWLRDLVPMRHGVQRKKFPGESSRGVKFFVTDWVDLTTGNRFISPFEYLGFSESGPLLEWRGFKADDLDEFGYTVPFSLEDSFLQ
jgi:hypothetical protein